MPEQDKKIIKNIKMFLGMFWLPSNFFLSFSGITTILKYILTENEPDLIVLVMCLASFFGIMMGLLGFFSIFFSSLKILLFREFFIVLAIILWCSLSPLYHLMIASQDSIRKAWAHVEFKNQTRDMIKWQRSIHCCGLNGPTDYPSDVKIPCFDTFEKNFNQDGCLQAAHDHYEHFTQDFDMWMWGLLACIVIDAVVTMISIKIRNQNKLSQKTSEPFDDVTEV